MIISVRNSKMGLQASNKGERVEYTREQRLVDRRMNTGVVRTWILYRSNTALLYRRFDQGHYSTKSSTAHTLLT